MHVALIANSAWLEEELPTLRHLTVGLIDEQVRVAQVVPEQVHANRISGFGERLTWRPSRIDWIDQRRLAHLDEALENLDVELVHALDGRLWRAAVKLADRMNVPVVLGAGDRRDLRIAERLAGRLNRPRTAFAAAGEALSTGLRQRLGDDVMIETIPLGVPPADEIPPRPRGDWCVIVSGDGVLDSRYQALLEAIGEAVGEYPHMQFFFDGLGSDQHELWNAASRLDLMAHVSLVPQGMDRRDLLMRGDLFCQPQSLGRPRSLTLEAMAHAVPVLAAEDAWDECLIDGQTARLVSEPTAEAWAHALKAMAADRAAAEALGRGAREWVRENRSVSRMVEATLYLYRQITGQALPFPETGT